MTLTYANKKLRKSLTSIARRAEMEENTIKLQKIEYIDHFCFVRTQTVWKEVTDSGYRISTFYMNIVNKEWVIKK